MKKTALVLLFSFVAMGCKDFDGQLNVSKDIELKQRYLFGSKKRQFAPGNYAAKLSIKGETKFNLLITKGDDTMKFGFEVPKNSMPRYEGEFNVPAVEMEKQKYGFAGIVTSDISDGPEQRTSESCSKTFRINVCRCKENSEGRRYKSCKIAHKSIYGSKDVSYYYRRTTTTIMADMLDQADQVVADFSGKNYETDKIYTYQGQCYLNQRPPRDRGRYLRCRDRRRGPR